MVDLLFIHFFSSLLHSVGRQRACVHRTGNIIIIIVINWVVRCLARMDGAFSCSHWQIFLSLFFSYFSFWNIENGFDLEREKYKVDYDISKPSNCRKKRLTLKIQKLWTLILFYWDSFLPYCWAWHFFRREFVCEELVFYVQIFEKVEHV